VIYFDKHGREEEILARAIVVAGNAVETPRLLLLSKSSLFPDGLANLSGLVGKRFTEHLSVFAYGLCSDGEQLPDERNQVKLDPRVKDAYGLPVPLIINNHYQNDLAMIDDISR